CAHLPSVSFEATWRHHLKQEPDAVMPHVRICGGGYEQSPVPTPTDDGRRYAAVPPSAIARWCSDTKVSADTIGQWWPDYNTLTRAAREPRRARPIVFVSSEFVMKKAPALGRRRFFDALRQRLARRIGSSILHRQEACHECSWRSHCDPPLPRERP